MTREDRLAHLRALRRAVAEPGEYPDPYPELELMWYSEPESEALRTRDPEKYAVTLDPGVMVVRSTDERGHYSHAIPVPRVMSSLDAAMSWYARAVPGQWPVDALEEAVRQLREGTGWDADQPILGQLARAVLCVGIDQLLEDTELAESSERE